MRSCMRSLLLVCLGFICFFTTLVQVVATFAQAEPGRGFIENEGQLDAAVAYFTHASGISVYLTQDAIVLDIVESISAGGSGDTSRLLPEGFANSDTPIMRSGCAIWMSFEGPSLGATIEAIGELPQKFNYLLGRNRDKWRTHVRAFATVVYRDLWPGIDLVIAPCERGFTYELRSERPVDPSIPRFRFQGHDRLVAEFDGATRLETSAGLVSIQNGVDSPSAYSVILQPGPTTSSHGSATKDDPTQLTWSTFLGGAQDERGTDLTLDSTGNTVLSGFTISPDFPFTPGAYDTTCNNTYDTVVAKLSGDAQNLLWATYYGGDELNQAHSVALDQYDNPIVVGHVGAWQAFIVKFNSTGTDILWEEVVSEQSIANGIAFADDDQPIVAGFMAPVSSRDVWVTKLDTDTGAELWSRTYGGGEQDFAANVVVTNSGHPVLVGTTWSGDFPVTKGAAQASYGGGIRDIFAMRVDGSNGDLVWCTYVGGAGSDEGNDLTIDSFGNPIVVGASDSPDYPTTPGAYQEEHKNYLDVCVTKLSSDGLAIIWSTFIGGQNSGDQGFSIEVGQDFRPILTGYCASEDFPTTANAFDQSFNGPLNDAFVSQLNSSGTELLWSTFLGGSSNDEGTELTLDLSGAPLVTGWAKSPDFPSTAGVYEEIHQGARDIFISKFDIPAVGSTGQNSWWEVDPAGSSPAARQGHSAVYDPVRDRIIVFGGHTGVPLNDTWELSLSGHPTWTQLVTAGTPPDARLEHSAIYDPIGDRMIVFGGNSGTVENDTWELTLSGVPTWSELSPAGTLPTGRFAHSAIYDPIRERMIIFGCHHDWSHNGLLWELSLAGPPTWTELAPSGGGPSQRGNHAVIYDPVRDRMLLFGGDAGPILNDTWSLSLGTNLQWALESPTGSPPSSRYAHSTTYDPGGDRMIVFGGCQGYSVYNDTYLLSLSGDFEWTSLAATGGLPPVRLNHVAVHHPGWNQMMVFGGLDASNNEYDDVWRLVLDAAEDLTLSTPANGTTVNADNIPFAWSEIGASFYELWADDNSDFSSPEIEPFHFEPFDCDSLYVTYFPWGAGWLAPGTYYWKVRANTGAGYVESEVWTFTYSPPSAPDPIWGPLYRLYNAEDKDHFYCTSDGHQQIAQDQGYREERVEGWLSHGRFDDPDQATLFRFYDDARDCHYYTVREARLDSLIEAGLRYEGITGYAYRSPQPGLAPLYHLSAPELIDNLYTTSEVERQFARDVLGFAEEEIIGYVSPSGDTVGLPAHQFSVRLAGGISASTGNLRHYSRSSFNIPSIGLSLTFEHVYNSSSVHLLSQIMPFGPGWSHTYNAYILTIPDQWLVSWPDGSIHRYSQSTGECLDRELGVYDEIEILPGGKFEITKNNQVVYTFERPAGVPAEYPSLLTSIKDRNQNEISLTYEGADLRRLVAVTGPAARELTFTYHTDTLMTHLISTVDDIAGARSIHFAYEDSNRNLTAFTDCSGKVTQYIYDYEDPQLGQDHQLTRVILPEGNVIDNTYQDRRITGQSWTGSQLTLTYEDNQTTVEDGEGQQTQYTFDALSRVEEVLDLTGGTGSESIWREDPVNPALPTRVRDRNLNETVFTYDGRGNPLTIARPLGVTHGFVYDAQNNVTKHTDPNLNETDYGYDGSGNLTSVTDQLTHVTTYVPLSNGLVDYVTNPLGHQTDFSYDSHGNLTGVQDHLGNSSLFEYDQIGRVTQQTDAEAFVTSYEYDCDDRLTLSTDPETGSTSYTYDDNGNLTRVTDPMSHATDWTYNDLDLVETVTNAVGDETSFIYNEDGTLDSRTRPTGSVSYTYDLAGRLSGISSSSATITRDANGNITGLSDAGGSLSYFYDALNRLTSYTDYYGNAVEYDYDLAGNLLHLTYEPGKVVTYTYYDDNRLHTVSDWNGRTTSYTYRDDGSLETISYPNGTVATFSYDLADRVVGLSHNRSDASVIASYSYTLDGRGYHESETRTEPLVMPVLPNQTVIYAYDDANRLTTAGAASYDYDGAGNMISRTGPDNIGCAYDLENRLTAITGSANASFGYDTFGNRRIATRSGTTRRYVLNILGMSQVLIETDAGGAPVNYYIYGLGLISRVKPDGTTHCYHFNNVGSIVAMTDQNENITHSYLYSPFGRVLDSVEADENRFQFVGYHGVMSEVAGLSFLRARYVETVSGRFLSEDPIWSPQKYVYCSNNPLFMVDPDGMRGVRTWLGDATDLFLSSAKKIVTATKFYEEITHHAPDFVGRMRINKLGRIEGPLKFYTTSKFIIRAAKYSYVTMTESAKALWNNEPAYVPEDPIDILRDAPFVGLGIQFYELERDAYKSLRELLGD